MSALGAEMSDPRFWLDVLELSWINILLSGDNAVVIALACRQLPPRSRKWGVALGAAVAVGLRIAFTGAVTSLLEWQWLKFIGALALLYIAIDLIKPGEDQDEKQIKAHDSLARAVLTVAIADIVMSLDNVVAIAAIAKGSWALITIGLAMSIPLIVIGASLITALFVRFPIAVWVGAGLLGWVAGELMISDPGIVAWIGEDGAANFRYVASTVGALLVVAIGYARHRRHAARARPEGAASAAAGEPAVEAGNPATDVSPLDGGV